MSWKWSRGFRVIEGGVEFYFATWVNYDSSVLGLYLAYYIGIWTFYPEKTLLNPRSQCAVTIVVLVFASHPIPKPHIPRPITLSLSAYVRVFVGEIERQHFDVSFRKHPPPIRVVCDFNCVATTAPTNLSASSCWGGKVT